MNIVEIVRRDLRESCEYDDSYFQFFLGMIHLVPWLVSAAFTGVAAYSREIYYPIMTAALWLNTILIYALTNVIADPAPIPGCGGTAALPSLPTEHAFFLYVYILIGLHVFGLRVRIFHIFLLQLWASVTWIAAVVLGFNSQYQVVWGALSGTGIATAVNIVVYFVMRSHHTAILDWWVTEWAGYSDETFVQDNTAKVRRRDFSIAVMAIKLEWDDAVDLYNAGLISDDDLDDRLFDCLLRETRAGKKDT